MTPLTIRQMADRFGVTLRALRFYESKDLLSPRHDGPRRLYDADDVAAMERILRWRAMGLPVDTMFRIEAGLESEETALRTRRAALVTEQARLTAQSAHVETALRDLTAQSQRARFVAALHKGLGIEA